MKNITAVAGSILTMLLTSTMFTSLQGAQKPEAQQEFETLAAKCSYFEIDDVLFNRGNAFADQRAANSREYPQVIAGLAQSGATRSELTALLKHDNPKVRTLAIAALALRNDPGVLPFIADLLSDDAITFSRQSPPVQSAMVKPELRNDVTVGENAQEVLFQYLSPAGYTGYQLLGKRTESQKSRKEFDAYWSTHKDREFCASWFAVQLRRASRGTPEGFAAERARVRTELEKIHQPERAWICLWLRNECPDALPYPREELIGICRETGPVALLDALKKQQFPSNDPDLQHGNGSNYNFAATALFILQNASSLLRPEDSETLLSLNTEEAQSPWWFIAAADLQPAKAAEILHKAYDQFAKESQSYERATLSASLWDLAGESQISFLIEKFYADALAQKSQNNGWGSEFIHGITRSKRQPGAKLVAAILRDKRLDDYKLDRMTFTSIAQAVNQWAGKPIVSDEEIAAAGKGEGGKGGDPTPINLPLKHELLHRMRDREAEWIDAKPLAQEAGVPVRLSAK